MHHVVSFHDTDCTKSVYYSRIFEWLDPIRLEMFEKHYKGAKQLENDGEAICIYGCSGKLLKRMTIGDHVNIETDVTAKKASFNMKHRYYVNGELTATASIHLAYFVDGSVSRFPVELAEALKKF